MYTGMRTRARRNSMTWWGFKIVQGMMLGCTPMLAGGLFLLLALVVSDYWCMAVPGVLAILVGIGVLVRYILAPLTCRWIVTVPENAYFLVEDFDGYTLEYLNSGRMLVPWRWSTRIGEYVTFKSVDVAEMIEHVLPTDGTVVAIDVTVKMAFNPVKADPGMFVTLRQMRTQDQFRGMIARDVREAVQRYLQQIHPLQQTGALRSVRTLESVVADKLRNRAAMGLTLAGTYPVSVAIRVPQRVTEAFRQIYNNNPGIPYDDNQILMDLYDLSVRTGIPYEEIYRLYLLQRRKTPPPPPRPSSGPRPSRGPSRPPDPYNQGGWWPSSGGPADWPTQPPDPDRQDPTIPGGQAPPAGPTQYRGPDQPPPADPTMYHGPGQVPPDNLRTQFHTPPPSAPPPSPDGATGHDDQPTLRQTPPDPLLRRRPRRRRPLQDDDQSE